MKCHKVDSLDVAVTNGSHCLKMGPLLTVEPMCVYKQDTLADWPGHMHEKPGI